MAAVDTEYCMHCSLQPTCICSKHMASVASEHEPSCPCRESSCVFDQHAAAQPATANMNSVTYKHHKRQFDDEEGHL